LISLFLGEAIPLQLDFMPIAKLYHNVFIELPMSLESLRTEKLRSEAVKMAGNNAVLIEKKPLMNYVLACLSLVHTRERWLYSMKEEYQVTSVP
jgi:hypothetical protein